jgi:toxin-antitoxin system PIN domain toxin
VIAVDTNILVYAHREDSPWHSRAEASVRGLAEGAESWAIAWSCIHEFLAIVTHPSIYKPPTPLEKALEQVEAWLKSPSLQVIGEAPDHWAELSFLLRDSHVVGPKVHDARVAAIIKGHGIVEIWSVDRDFSRFKGIRVVNPLL